MLAVLLRVFLQGLLLLLLLECIIVAALRQLQNTPLFFFFFNTNVGLKCTGTVTW